MLLFRSAECGLLVFSGESLWRGLWSWLPAPWNERIQDSLRQSFQSYFAGQALAKPLLRNLAEISSVQGSVGWVEE
jgi:hypothetical protein